MYDSDDHAVAQGAFDFAKTRFVRSLDNVRTMRLMEKAAKERARLVLEIDNLRRVTRDRHATAVEHARTYGAVLPHRVGTSWIKPPAAHEKFGAAFGADRLYKRAVLATKEFAEARDLLEKRRNQLSALDAEVQQRLDEREAVLLGQLESPRSLRIARQLDPLLDDSYQKLQAATSES